MPHRETYKMMQRIESELTKNGVSPEELEIAKENWHHFNMFDLAQPITMGIGEHLQNKVTDVNERLRKLPSPTNAADPTFLALVETGRKLSETMKSLSEVYTLGEIRDAPERIRKCLKDCGALTEAEKAQIFEQHREALADLEHYRDNHDFRSIDRWFRLSEL